MYSILLVFITFNAMIVIHELGHFIVAKLSGMEVKEFAIGFGKKIYSKKYKNTIYSLRCLPFGGFNNISMNKKDKNEETNFYHKSLFKRLSVLLAGSFFNLISAFLMLFLMLIIYGIPNASSNTINSVVSNSYASQYLMPEDKIISINNNFIENEIISDNEKDILKSSSVINLKIIRNSQEQEIQINKTQNEPLGIILGSTYKKISISEAFEKSISGYEKIIKMIFTSLNDLFFQRIDATKSLAGPAGVVTIMYNANNEMGLFGLMFVFIIISINLGIFNLFPIPLLDGGHITIQIIEAVIKKQLNEKQEKVLTYIGLTFMGIMFILGTYSDILRFLNH